MPNKVRLYIVASALALATMAERMGWFAISVHSRFDVVIIILLYITAFLLVIVGLVGAVTLAMVRLCTGQWRP